jgi:mRNA interferase YafQ
MRTISRTGSFKRDYKRVIASPQGSKIEGLLRETIALLAEDRLLPERRRDHPLTGEWTGFRDCHLLPDCVLIYRKIGDADFELVRLGSHSALRL